MIVRKFTLEIEDATPEQIGIIAAAVKRAGAKGGPIAKTELPEPDGPGGPDE